MDINTKKYTVVITACVVCVVVTAGAYFALKLSRAHIAKKSVSTEAIPTKQPETSFEVDIRDKLNLGEQESLAEPGNTDHLKDTAESQFLLGEYAESANTYEQSLELNKEDATTYLGLGNAYVQQNEFEKAIEAFEKAIQLGGAGTQPYIQLASLYQVRQPDREKVIDSYSRGIKEFPQETVLRILLGSFYQDMGDKDNAIEEYYAVLRIDPNNLIAKQMIDGIEGK